MPEDPEKYRRANLYLQIGLGIGVVVLLLAATGVMNFDYGFYACIICVAAGAAVRQIIVSRD